MNVPGSECYHQNAFHAMFYFSPTSCMLLVIKCKHWIRLLRSRSPHAQLLMKKAPVVLTMLEMPAKRPLCFFLHTPHWLYDRRFNAWSGKYPKLNLRNTTLTRIIFAVLWSFPDLGLHHLTPTGLKSRYVLLTFVHKASMMTIIFSINLFNLTQTLTLSCGLKTEIIKRPRKFFDWICKVIIWLFIIGY